MSRFISPCGRYVYVVRERHAFMDDIDRVPTRTEIVRETKTQVLTENKRFVKDTGRIFGTMHSLHRLVTEEEWRDGVAKLQESYRGRAAHLRGEADGLDERIKELDDQLTGDTDGY